MVLQMNNVVAHDEFQIEIFAVRGVPNVTEGALVHVTDEPGELNVVRSPKIDDLFPWPILVALRANPLVAVVARQVDAVDELQACESLVIVRRRIDQMTEDFLLRPLAWLRAQGCGRRIDLT